MKIRKLKDNLKNFLSTVVMVFILTTGVCQCKPIAPIDSTTKTNSSLSENRLTENFVLSFSVEMIFRRYINEKRTGYENIQTFLEKKWIPSKASKAAEDLNRFYEEQLKKTQKVVVSKALFNNLNFIYKHFKNSKNFSNSIQLNLSDLIVSEYGIRATLPESIVIRYKNRIPQIANQIIQNESVVFPQGFMSFVANYWNSFSQNADRDLYAFGSGTMLGVGDTLIEIGKMSFDTLSLTAVIGGEFFGIKMYFDPKSHFFQMVDKEGLGMAMLSGIAGTLYMVKNFSLAIVQGNSQQIGYQLVNIESFLFSVNAGVGLKARLANVKIPSFGVQMFPCGGALCLQGITVATEATISSLISEGFSAGTVSGVNIVLRSGNGAATPKPLASELPLVSKGSPSWKNAVKEIQDGTARGLNFRVKNQKIAAELVQEAKPKLSKRNAYARDKAKAKGENVPDEGWEYHRQDETLPNPKTNRGGVKEHDRLHIKFYDIKKGAEGHIFFDEWVWLPGFIKNSIHSLAEYKNTKTQKAFTKVG